ncbi:MarR family winged helix-turn-helix transcriptional regulator [Loigolactobacillus bifermentans]|jgi:DNA-binding MarR family transcriptional regulator|uniref:Transcriptional regulator n=1 Tax=Loigolactobacillus bifermentans DSM 20003 TaxID=1423726 RepID=A0A0R1GND1_9LACO|nr:MarR family transcriptional regulator [Loigolactobacillus bifermentans]KRK35424.1 transcriptional regulator [Loigolactobacillus bifermentans DSM 20003]QGG60411.1 MarR family transcriptional regulator [Loigolactobacillus bifermentans]
MTHDSQTLLQLFGRLMQQHGFISVAMKSWQFDKHGHSRQPQQGQLRVLRLLADKGQLTNSQIVEALDIRPSSASALVNKLEERGFITRQPDENDKRILQIVLTEAGQNFLDNSHQLKDELSESLFAGLTADEQQQLTQLMAKLVQHLEDNPVTWENTDWQAFLKQAHRDTDWQDFFKQAKQLKRAKHQRGRGPFDGRFPNGFRGPFED